MVSLWIAGLIAVAFAETPCPPTDSITTETADGVFVSAMIALQEVPVGSPWPKVEACHRAATFAAMQRWKREAEVSAITPSDEQRANERHKRADTKAAAVAWVEACRARQQPVATEAWRACVAASGDVEPCGEEPKVSE